jgi:hypothetical protein
MISQTKDPEPVPYSLEHLDPINKKRILAPDQKYQRLKKRIDSILYKKTEEIVLGYLTY